MDINDARTIITVLSFLSFVGIVAWAYSQRRRSAFEEAALLPFDEEERPVAAAQRGEGRQSGGKR